MMMHISDNLDTGILSCMHLSMYTQRIPYTQIGEWIVNCITPLSLRDLLFCEYLHLVCCVALMSKKEILRLIFGTVCDEKHQTIT